MGHVTLRRAHANKHTCTHLLTTPTHKQTITTQTRDSHTTKCARTSKPPPIGHVMRTSTRARTHALTHIHRSRDASARTHHSPPAAHASHTHPGARTHKQTPKNMN